MTVKFTVTQRQRLKELNVSGELLVKSFADIRVRDDFFRKVEKKLINENKKNLEYLLEYKHLPMLIQVENSLKNWLCNEMGFTQVVTPVIISEQMLTKMSISEDHPLRKQVYWLDNKRCMRPMLAPNLYELMRDIHKITNKPVCIFESGPCFRKESQGSQHLNEFTMINLVEFAGVEDGKQEDRLIEIAEGAMKALNLHDYRLEITDSEVYGKTIDILCDEVEIASGAYGPHPLDSKWGIFDTVWVGIGFGLERIAMKKGSYNGIKRVGRSLYYLDGIRLNV